MKCKFCEHDIEQHEKSCNGFRGDCIIYSCRCEEFKGIDPKEAGVQIHISN